MSTPRVVRHAYRDPLSEVWLATAAKIGLQVERTEDAFAHTDGHGRLFIATDCHLDEDDCLAQMIFHELCHSLVEGPEAFATEDWGLDNRHEEHHIREHAALRVQATLAGREGLREVLGPTTDFRAYYDALGADAMNAPVDASIALAKPALRRAQTSPWWPHLGKALAATREMVAVTARFAAPSALPALYRLRAEPLAVHPSGLPGRNAEAEGTCSTCAWRTSQGHCHQADSHVEPQWSACERFEPPFDCQDCGACCRSAYHSVTIAEGDIVAEKHPALMVVHENYTEVRREGDHCAALRSADGRHACTIYDDRPTCCREFENAGIHCVTARRRLGFTL